jgi:hypothetical protein
MPISKGLRITGYFLLSFITILIIAGILMNVYFNKKIIENVKARISEITHNEYALSLDGLSINFFTNTITVENLIIGPSKKGIHKNAQYVFKAKTFKIIEFSLLSYLKNHDLLIEKIEFEEPQISIFQGVERLPVKNIDTLVIPFSLYKAFSKTLNSIAIGNIEIVNSQFNIYKNGTDTLSVFSTKDNSVSIKKFIINSETDQKHRLFFADKFEIVMNKFSYHLGNGLYTIYGKSLYASYVDSIVTVDSLQVVPNFSKKEFAEEAGRQISRVKIISSKVNFRKMDVKLFFEYNWLVINKVDLSGCAVDVYRDNRLPLQPIKRPSVQNMLRDLPFFVAIDSIEMKDGNVTYQETNSDQSTSGKLTLNKINALVTGVQNDTESYTDSSFIKAKINGVFLNKGLFKQNFTFPLKAKEELFYCSGSLSSISLITFNQLISPSKFLKIKSGQLDTAIFSFVAYENASNGTMKLLYHDLNIEAVKKNGEKIKLKDQVKIFVANELIIRNSNPDKNGVVRISKIHAEHNHYRYFPYYAMQSIISGIEPAIINENAAKLLNKKSN